AAAPELLTLGPSDLDDALAVPDRGLSYEVNRVEAAARLGDLEPIARIQRGVVAEGLHEIPAADVPAAPQRRVAVEVQLLVLDAPAVDEVLILPDAIDHDVTREAQQQRARLPVGRVARIDVRMHDARATDEPARRAKVVRDAGEHAAQSPDAMLNRELREPQRRGRRDGAGAVAAPGQLQVQAIDVPEDQPAVHLGHAIVVAALDAIGVRHADARSMSQAALRAQNIEDRIVGAARRRELLIDRGQKTDVGAAGVARELDRRDRLHDTAGGGHEPRPPTPLPAPRARRPHPRTE